MARALWNEFPGGRDAPPTGNPAYEIAARRADDPRFTSRWINSRHRSTSSRTRIMSAAAYERIAGPAALLHVAGHLL